jgi:hypothetical protein
MNERGNPALHIGCPPTINPSFGKFSPKRGIFPLRRISRRDHIEMAIEDECSSTSPPSSFGYEVPSPFWRENGLGFETHLGEERFQKLRGTLFISRRIFRGSLN